MWRPIADFVMPERLSGYDRHRMLLQLAPGHSNQPYVCEGYAQYAMIGKRPNQRAVLRFYDAGGHWLTSVEFFQPLPEPRKP